MHTLKIHIFNNPFDMHHTTTQTVQTEAKTVDISRYYPDGFFDGASVYNSLNDLEPDITQISMSLEYLNVFKLPQGDKPDPFSAVNKLDPFSAVNKLVSDAKNMLKPKMPNVPSIEQPDTLASVLNRPTGSVYSVREQRNVARLGEPIPTQYGRFEYYPDLAATPWFEYVDDVQQLHQLFCLGWGTFDIHKIKLGDIDADNLDYVSYEVYEPNEAVTLFHDNMYTIPISSEINSISEDKIRRVIDGNITFNVTAKTMAVTSSEHKFKSLFSVGDSAVIDHFTDVYNGEFVITSVTDTVLTFEDVSSWPSTATETGLNLRIWNKKDIQDISWRKLNPGLTNSIIYAGYSDTYISNPSSTELETMYFDVSFKRGIFNYDPSTSEYSEHTMRFSVVLRPIDINGDPITSVTGPISLGISGSGDTYTGLSNFNWWDDSRDLTFYEDGVAIPESDISSIDYGTNDDDPQVIFTSDKTGAITAVGHFRYYTETVQTFDYTAFSLNPIQKTFEFTPDIDIYYDPALGPVRYLINIGRLATDEKWDGSEAQSDGVITGIRTKLKAVSKFGPYTMLAVNIDARSNTNEIGKIKVNSTRKLNTYDGRRWTAPTATRSIAWALADIYMTLYGGGNPRSRLDLDKLTELDAIWTSRGDTFDGVFDSNSTVWEALTKVARVGRAVPVFDNQILTFVRNEAKTTYTAMFGTDNMLPGSFNIDYRFPDDRSVRGVKLKYIDEDTNYKTAEIIAGDDKGKTQEIDFFGCVNYDQAWREAQFIYSQIINENTTITFKTEMSGHIPFYGDLISVQHDLPSWGQGGLVAGKSGTSITLNAPVDWSGTAPYKIAFTKPNGQVSGPHTVTQGVTADIAILENDVTDFTFITARTNQNPTQFQFGPSVNWSKPCIITQVKPGADNETVAITCVPYVESIHTADTATVETKPVTIPNGLPKPPKITGLNVTRTRNSRGEKKINLEWNPVNNVSHSTLEVYSEEHAVWQRIYINYLTPSINNDFSYSVNDLPPGTPLTFRVFTAITDAANRIDYFRGVYTYDVRSEYVYYTAISY